MIFCLRAVHLPVVKEQKMVWNKFGAKAYLVPGRMKSGIETGDPIQSSFEDCNQA